MWLGCKDVSKDLRMKFDGDFKNPSVNMNKTLSEITCNINKEIHTQMGKVEQGLSILSSFVSFLILLLILEAIWYWWSYIHKVSLMNVQLYDVHMHLFNQKISGAT